MDWYVCKKKKKKYCLDVVISDKIKALIVSLLITLKAG
jgi:hypothetical protein